jgi:hypothetical protein
MLKKAASCVLAFKQSSTYPRGYASGCYRLRPCWTVFLNILRVVTTGFELVFNRPLRFLHGCGLLGKGRVLARLGLAGAIVAFLDILRVVAPGLE